MLYGCDGNKLKSIQIELSTLHFSTKHLFFGKAIETKFNLHNVFLSIYSKDTYNT